MIEHIGLHTLFSDPLCKEMIWRDEILSIHEKYGPIDFYRFDFDVSQDYFAHWHDILRVQKKRRGEIALCVVNSHNRILLHTKLFYPSSTYRIPTGGIHFDESVIDACFRELDEETSLRAVSVNQLALLLYLFRHRQDVLPFVSYIFKVHVERDKPRVRDEGEAISGFRWITRSELGVIIQHLKSLEKNQWREWGIMRAAPHEIIENSLA
ncbi:NUDIX hydrolase [candidate division KSB1 bacterium]|nr:NUDIX hydrolase [candidate division KSB1 bacterium]